MSGMRRRAFITLLGGAAAWPLAARAQRPEKMHRIGVLWPGAPPDKWDAAFRQGLHTLGYVEGRDVLLEYRWAEGKQELLPRLAEELTRLKVDVIVTISAPAILARRAETRFRTRHHEGLFFRCDALALAAPAEVFQPQGNLAASP